MDKNQYITIPTSHFRHKKILAHQNYGNWGPYQQFLRRLFSELYTHQLEGFKFVRKKNLVLQNPIVIINNFPKQINEIIKKIKIKN